MDVLNQLTDPNKTFVPIRIKTGTVNGRMQYESVEESDSSSSENEIEKGIDYAKNFQEKEEAKYAENILSQDEHDNMSMPESNDDIPSSIKAEVDHMKQEEVTKVFNKYTFTTHLQTNKLTIETHKIQILELIKSYSVVIIHGPTGCGKTTQVPQFILDDCQNTNSYCNIIVTQPRRIAAISVAQRVCEERGWSLGSVCGYQVSLEKQASNDTILNYVTTGILLQKLISVKNLNEYTHIIVDEIHERNQEMDFLIILLRKFLYMNSFRTKIILMSATFDTEKFSKYFNNISRSDINIRAPTVFVTNKRKHNTQIFYADQLSSIGRIPDFNFEEPRIQPCLYKLLKLLIHAFNRLDGENNQDTKTKKIGNVLVFLPGIYEIEQAYTSLQNTSSDEISYETDWFILPLHSSITNDEQRRVFCPPPLGKRKIILSTNIAESSITVPDIAYVIDFCLIKTLVLDPQTQYQSLKLQWASQDNCTQRAGRVGRVCDGRVYRLVTKSFYEKRMDKSIVPEILRSPLERLVLASKLLEITDPPKAILALALDPPDLSNIESTIWKLKECGGLLTTCQGVKMTSNGDLTFLGRVMASLPVDVHLSKLIILGHMYSCLEECIIMAAGCSLSNLFSTPFQERLKAYTNKLMWADGSCSDLITFLNLYRVWNRNKRTNAFVNYRGEQEWARKNFLSVRNLKEWSLLINEIKARLTKLGIVDTVGPDRVILNQSETSLFMKVVICGAFYPNYFKRSPECGQVDEREAMREIAGRNPFNTVYFKGMDQNHPGPLYASRIKELIADCGNNTQVSFENSKVFVHFMKNTQHEAITIDGQQFISTIPGKICMEVYRAVRRRQLKIETPLHVLSKDEGWNRARLVGISRDNSRVRTVELYKSLVERNKSSILPTSDVQYMKIRISSRIDPGHFWAHNDDEQTKYNLYHIEKELNNKQLQTTNGIVVVGEIYAGLYETNNMYYRCRVISLNPLGKMGILTAHVLYIDYGNIGIITLDKIFFLPPEIKMKQPQAIECVLAGIQPSVVLNPRALWTENGNELFDKCTRNISLFAKIYSVVNGVVHLILYKKQPTSNDTKMMSFNDWLIEKEYAQPAEESYLSKINHEKRLQIETNNSNYFHVPALSAEEDVLQIPANDVKSPSISECRNVIHLKGPFSPLEMQIFSCTEIGITKQIVIEGSSVNSVLLDSNPEDSHERLIVAGSINQNASATTLILRHTSIMPNIPGFPMLMSLLFCPTMEPKPSLDGSRFACILCGLGTTETNKRSLYPVHDMVVVLDTELDQEDLNNINTMRYWMNMAIEIMENVDNSTSLQDFISAQQELKTCLMKLLKKRRKSVPRINVNYSSVWKKFLYEGEILLPGGSENIVENRIWPLHWTMALNNETEEIELKQNMTDLQDMATKTIAMNEISCKVCDLTMYNIQEIRVHLVSQIHINNMKLKNLS